MRDARGSSWRVVLIVLFAMLVGCATAAGPPVIRAGESCAACGMAIHDLHFASARGSSGKARVYDAIECLLRDSTAEGPAWLPDYDQSVLHDADSMWVVRGEIVSPMGGGYAAFLDSTAAAAVAAEHAGRVGRLSDFAAEVSR